MLAPMIPMLVAALLALPAQAGKTSKTARAAKPAPFTIESIQDGSAKVGGKEAKAGGAARSGETIVLKGGRAVLDFRGLGKLLFKGPGVLRLRGWGVTLESGSLLATFRRPHDEFTVRTARVVAAVRGTTFYVEARPDETYLCLCKGDLKVRAPKERPYRREFKAEHHDGFLFREGDQGLSESKVPMSGHTDAEIAELIGPAAH